MGLKRWLSENLNFTWGSPQGASLAPAGDPYAGMYGPPTPPQYVVPQPGVNVYGDQPLALPFGGGYLPGEQVVDPTSVGGMGMVGAGAGVVGVGSRAARYVMTAMGRMTKARVVGIAKKIGPYAAAAGLGLSAVEVAQWLWESDNRKKRPKGITGAQLRTARRVNRRIVGEYHRLKDGFRGADARATCAPRRRRTTARR